MSASHNPGGPKEDWGIKFNYSSGEPAPERITDAIYKYTQSIKEYKTADLPDIDLAKVGNNKFGSFEVTLIRIIIALTFTGCIIQYPASCMLACQCLSRCAAPCFDVGLDVNVSGPTSRTGHAPQLS